MVSVKGTVWSWLVHQNNSSFPSLQHPFVLSGFSFKQFIFVQALPCPHIETAGWIVLSAFRCKADVVLQMCPLYILDMTSLGTRIRAQDALAWGPLKAVLKMLLKHLNSTISGIIFKVKEVHCGQDGKHSDLHAFLQWCDCSLSVCCYNLVK